MLSAGVSTSVAGGMVTGAETSGTCPRHAGSTDAACVAGCFTGCAQGLSACCSPVLSAAQGS